MANPLVWKNVAVFMQSAIATAKTITAISKANPAVCSSTAHGYSNGDEVLLDNILGMWQLNQKVVRVVGVATDSFSLEGVDSTLFETFTSGTAQKLTFGTSITSATNLSASGGEFAMVDTTTIHGNAKSEVPGLPSAISYQMDHIWDAADSGLLALKAANDIQARRAFKFRFGVGGLLMYFCGYVGCSLIPGGSAQGLVTTKGVVTMNGTPTYYAS